MERNDARPRVEVAWTILLLLCAPNVLVAQEAGSNSSGADPHDALTAALGEATLRCLGTVGPDSFAEENGRLGRTFDRCPTGDRHALHEIDALLGVQRSEAGRSDRLGAHFAGRWSRFRSAGPDPAAQCPVWTLIERRNEPTREAVRRAAARPEQPQKTTARYRVSAPGCPDGRCAVDRALGCAGGFGDLFIVSADAGRAEVVVDPTWWLWNDVYPDDEPDANPFKAPGYYHPMSYFGRLPGARYAALARAGEPCSRYDEISGKHYIHYLHPIECSPGWKCMSYCM